ncbi:hypothetical protein EJ08DRAFT_122717 [Tothia fuscella]|uniref:Uncharacterized protein n=1 Tax=Tothia fuscella TaxID=1048955 RepID=A0A9P4NVV8_9PEZI|nr:hypothetical protein EJ08DRAFT_122717 [Tothia fuscella]
MTLLSQALRQKPRIRITTDIIAIYPQSQSDQMAIIDVPNIYDNYLYYKNFWATSKATDQANGDVRPTHRLEHRENIGVGDVHLALLAVTEAMSDGAGHKPFGCVTVNSLAFYHNKEFLGPQRVVRPRRPLIIPWLISDAAKGIDFNTANPDQVRGILNDLAGSGHFFLAVLEPQSGDDETNPSDLPNILIMDSLPAVSASQAHELARDIMTFAENMKWYYGPAVDARIHFQPHGNLLWQRKEVANQAGNDWVGPCGIHTILNGWAYAMNVHDRINPNWKPAAACYDEAIEIIHSALEGYCDFWTIYWFMRASGFLYPFELDVYRNSQMGIMGPLDDIAARDMEECLLIEQHARFFEQTKAMDGTKYTVREDGVVKHGCNGEVPLEDHWEKGKNAENNQFAASKRQSVFTFTGLPTTQRHRAHPQESALAARITQDLKKAGRASTRGDAATLREGLQKAQRVAMGLDDGTVGNLLNQVFPDKGLGNTGVIGRWKETITIIYRLFYLPRFKPQLCKLFHLSWLRNNRYPGSFGRNLGTIMVLLPFAVWKSGSICGSSK